ncbi:hypothetical protein SDC9_94121 [bioreactor metagenome]|uniref:Uncharacterized protein n=1 Tax=bioreactor metagenome TaxID=1076179 RepID=A0A645A580_9ZZZZ
MLRDGKAALLKWLCGRGRVDGVGADVPVAVRAVGCVGFQRDGVQLGRLPQLPFEQFRHAVEPVPGNAQAERALNVGRQCVADGVGIALQLLCDMRACALARYPDHGQGDDREGEKSECDCDEVLAAALRCGCFAIQRLQRACAP